MWVVQVRWRTLATQTQFRDHATMSIRIAHIRREADMTQNSWCGNINLNTLQGLGMAATSCDHKPNQLLCPARQTSLGFCSSVSRALLRPWSGRPRTWGHEAERHAGSGRPLAVRPLLAAGDMRLWPRRLGGQDLQASNNFHLSGTNEYTEAGSMELGGWCLEGDNAQASE